MAETREVAVLKKGGVFSHFRFNTSVAIETIKLLKIHLIFTTISLMFPPFLARENRFREFSICSAAPA